MRISRVLRQNEKCMMDTLSGYPSNISLRTRSMCKVFVKEEMEAPLFTATLNPIRNAVPRAR